jgi:hypothetical protein
LAAHGELGDDARQDGYPTLEGKEIGAHSQVPSELLNAACTDRPIARAPSPGSDAAAARGVLAFLSPTCRAGMERTVALGLVNVKRAPSTRGLRRRMAKMARKVGKSHV